MAKNNDYGLLYLILIVLAIIFFYISIPIIIIYLVYRYYDNKPKDIKPKQDYNTRPKLPKKDLVKILEPNEYKYFCEFCGNLIDNSGYFCSDCGCMIDVKRRTMLKIEAKKWQN